MKDWHLVDSSKPSEAPDGFPRVAVASEQNLRAELERLRHGQPAIVGLEGPIDQALEIGIGGPVAGLRLFRNRRPWRIVTADRICSEKPIDFAFEENALSFWPDELLPVEQAIGVIIHFYKYQQLPDWVGWKEWNDEVKGWDIKRPAEAPRHPLPPSSGVAETATQRP